MKVKLIRQIFVFSLFVTGVLNSYGQGISLSDTTKLDKKISILNDKAFINFPKNAVITPRVADIMAADPNENRETRIFVDNDNRRLVFFAQELFVLGDNKLLAELSKQVEPDFDFERKMLFDNNSVFGVISTPSLFDSTSAAIIVNSLTVKMPDNTVFRIDAFINPEAFSLKEEYVKLTENIFKTFSAGSRKINLNPKEESYKLLGTESKFQFKLPKNYYVTVDEKYDFSVLKLNKFKNSLSDTTYTSVTIYVGRFPTYFHKEYGYTETDAVKTKGLFLQTPVEWLYLKDEAQSFFLKEQFIPSESIYQGLLLHVAMLSNKIEIIEELAKIVEDIKLVK
jgi:hypothetical protein